VTRVLSYWPQRLFLTVTLLTTNFVDDRKLMSTFYKAFHGLWQAKFPSSGLVLGSSQFSLLPKLPQKTTLNSKVVKIDSKIII